MKIKALAAREILDSRGLPTLETSLYTNNGNVFVASVPAGASTGSNEACELRDGGERAQGKGVLKAVSLIETHLSRLLVGREIDPYAIDEILCREGGPLLENIGSNTALSISIATVRAYAAARKKDLFEAVGELAGVAHFFIPQSMYNIVNGGVHAHNNLAIQEFLVRPQKSPSFAKSFQEITTLYHCLEKLLQSAGYVTPLGDEGGFSPSAKEGALSLTEEIVFEFIISAREKCGMLESVELAIDAAANTFYDKANKCYMLKSEHLTNAELVDRYMLWRTKYGLASIEDGCAEHDVAGWQKLFEKLNKATQIVGDDLCVTDENYIKKAFDQKCINAVVIKPNQKGTVTGAIKAAQIAKRLGCRLIVSHRSGETHDNFIADFAVGIGAEEFKGGAPARSERVAKYRRFVEIEKVL